MIATSQPQRFEELLEAHKGILFKVCNAYCPNRDDREDLAQEITIQLWQAFPRFDERLRFSTWMYRIALNVAISFYRRESARTRHVVPGGEALLNVAASPAGPSGDIERLYESLRSLNEIDRALLLLYLDGNTYREIGEVLGISETNVATRIGRLKDKLRSTYGTGSTYESVVGKPQQARAKPAPES